MLEHALVPIPIAEPDIKGKIVVSDEKDQSKGWFM
jgi:hypothetical protein